MKHSEETYVDIIKDSWFGIPTALAYMALGMIEELGEEKGKELFIKQVKEMGKHWGKNMLDRFQANQVEPSIANMLKDIDETLMYSIAWDGSSELFSDDEGVMEWRFCPIADTFKSLGPEAVEIGEIFCDYIDDAQYGGLNPGVIVTRESSLIKDGLCRLRFKMKK
jgi:hypothetical protein